jgi:precorrin-3B methylase
MGGIGHPSGAPASKIDICLTVIYGLSAAATANADLGVGARTVADFCALSIRWKTVEAIDADRSSRRPSGDFVRDKS